MSADTRQLEDAGLRDVHIPSGLRPYVAAMWSRRSYVWYVARSTLREKQMNSVLGNIWHLLNPLLQIAVYYVIFGVVLEVDRGVDNFITFLAIGTLAFTFCQRSTLSGAGSIVKNLGLIRAVEFPRAVLPFTSTLTETLSMLPSFLVIGVVAVVTGETPSPRWLLLIPVMGLLAIFNLGAALYAARATSVVRDVQQILPHFAVRVGCPVQRCRVRRGLLPVVLHAQPGVCLLDRCALDDFRQRRVAVAVAFCWDLDGRPYRHRFPLVPSRRGFLWPLLSRLWAWLA